MWASRGPPRGGGTRGLAASEEHSAQLDPVRGVGAPVAEEEATHVGRLCGAGG